jgi:hypothetical protein
MSKEELIKHILTLKEDIVFLKRKIEQIEKRNHKNDLKRKCKKIFT